MASGPVALAKCLDALTLRTSLPFVTDGTSGDHETTKAAETRLNISLAAFAQVRGLRFSV